ncbi:MAG: hypothetical protein Q7K03_07420 [Dehalococcoidia bacterium]|nr:hypothetical protein [Dehalococcoidia bacterium]
MSTNKITKVSTKSGKNGATAARVSRKRVELTPEEEERLIDEVAKLGIELHKDALKELARH